MQLGSCTRRLCDFWDESVGSGVADNDNDYLRKLIANMPNTALPTCGPSELNDASPDAPDKHSAHDEMVYRLNERNDLCLTAGG